MPSVDLAFKVRERDIKRDPDIEFVAADGNVLTNEPIAVHYPGVVERDMDPGENGKAKY